MRQHGELQAGDSIQIVLEDQRGIAEREAAVERMLGQVRGLTGVAEVRSPYDDASAVSADGTIGYATVTLDDKAESVPKADVTKIIDTAQAAAGDGLRVELGGDAVRGAEEEEGGAAEGA